MVWHGHSKSTGLFIALGSVVVALAVALQVGWIVINWRAGVLLVLGVLVFVLIITGVVLNTVFLVREIRRNEQHDAFINAVTHELKTPVASIRLYLETLQSRQVDEAKRRQFQQIMIEDCDRLLHTIDQVLRAGQAGAPVKRITGSPVNLADTVRDCVSLARVRHRLAETALRFSDSTGGSSNVLGAEDELRTAITNLVDNAVKYSVGAVDVLVELAPDTAGNLLLRVRDHGIGIPSGELRHIFKRFYRIQHTVGRVKGTGLGLFIVNAVAKRHGGRVYAESEGQGRGSTFTLQLPMAPRV